MKYLNDLGFEEEDLNKLKENLNEEGIKALELFKNIIKSNINTLKQLKITNYKDIFLNHPHVFLQDPDRLKNKLSKYEEEDLIKRLKENPVIIEKI